jgi:hypothetical protein
MLTGPILTGTTPLIQGTRCIWETFIQNGPGGFSTNLAFKGFTLFANFDYALGHTIYNDLVARTLGNYQGTFNYFDLQKSAWSPTNTTTDVPKSILCRPGGRTAGQEKLYQDQ